MRRIHFECVGCQGRLNLVGSYFGIQLAHKSLTGCESNQFIVDSITGEDPEVVPFKLPVLE